MAIKLLLWDNVDSKLIGGRSISGDCPGAPCAYLSWHLSMSVWRIARRCMMSCIAAFSLSCPRSNVINGTKRTPCTLLVYDCIVFLSFPRYYTFNASHRRSPFYFSWSNISRSLSIRSSAPKSIIRHMFHRYLFSFIIHANCSMIAHSYFFSLTFFFELLFDQPFPLFYIRFISVALLVLPCYLLSLKILFSDSSFFSKYQRGWLRGLHVLSTQIKQGVITRSNEILS